MLCSEDLLKLELFQKLSSDRLEWICDRAMEVRLVRGDILVKEGDPHRGFFILTSGSVSITRFSEGMEMPIGQHHTPSFFGEMQVMADDLMPVTLRALTDCEIYELKSEDFLQLVYQCRDFGIMVCRTVQRRVMGLQSFILNREKMAALGTLSAGLAHELNNPATAVVRSLQDIMPAMLELQRMNLVYGQRNVEDEHTQQWFKMRDDGYDFITNNSSDPLKLMDREDELLEWLEDYGVKEPWKLAQPLAAGNVEPKALDKIMTRWRDDTTELRDIGLRWLALSFEVLTMIQSGLRGAERVSELVQSMRSYTHLDRGAKQKIDVHQGLEDTLTLLSHKLKQGVKVKRTYDRSLPQIFAFGSELNQVWTNLIDNSIDAMAEEGELEIVTVNKSDRIMVKIIDSGEGIPPEIQSRVFELFFTTKEVGKSSGIGLDNVRRIVENRHRGSISLESKPGRTCFSIYLPVDPDETS